MAKRYVEKFTTRELKKQPIEEQINEFADIHDLKIIQVSYSVGVYPTCNIFEQALVLFEKNDTIDWDNILQVGYTPTL